ncbi:MAG: polysaccharide deacetylase family protein [Actinobacteria bacterium]|nr:polysaccharide deacetylase family protein [Actinomycetota bacterium]
MATTTPSTQPTSTTAAGRAGPARFVRNGPSDRPRIAFTFHGSGDVGLLRELLALAKNSHAPLTIFAVGTWLDANPAVADLIMGDGHELANHTYTHPALGGLARTAVASEVTRCRDALARHAAAPGPWFRPSGIEVPTALILEEAGRAGYPTVVGYDVDPRDYQDPGAAAVVDRVTAGLHAGAIVSLHTGHAGTVAAFERVVAAARQRGLEPVTVRDLLGVAR